MKITFWGATEDVTGSLTYLELNGKRIIIDCGMNQGPHEVEVLNDRPFPFPANSVDAVFLTHAHLDHCGFLPKLVSEGFNGPIYSTLATYKLAKIIMEDSAKLDNQKWYDIQDVIKTLNLFKKIDWDETVEFFGATIKFIPAGHILGAASLRIKNLGKTIVFSGDLGRKDDPLIPSPNPCPEADYVIMESTYGNRERKSDLEKDLYSFLMKISRESRVGIISSFAVARGQLLITMINEFFKRHPEERIQVYVDSPMMSKANDIYKSFSHSTLKSNELKEAMGEIDLIEYQGEWETLRKKSGPLLIISSSGMLTGGRISRHLKNWQDDNKAILFLPGYQGIGTPGRAFIEGKRDLKTSDDEIIHWSGEVLWSDAFSSHADQSELLNWISLLKKNTHIYLIHGEEGAKLGLKEALDKEDFQNVEIPLPLMEVLLT